MPVQLGFKAQTVIDEGRLTREDIDKVKSWIKEENNLPLISDEEIVNFLLSNDNDLKGTKNTIKAFFSVRNDSAEIFNDRIMSEENSKQMQGVAHFGISPERTKDNCAVILARLYDTNYQSFHLARFFKYLFMTLDAAIYPSPPKGLVIVIDMDGFGLMHLSRLRVGALSVFFRYLQEALPVKLVNMHILNTAYFIDKVLAIIKPFVSDHVNQLMIFHKREMDKNEFFKKYVPKHLLPKDFEGDLPCIEEMSQDLIKQLKEMEPYFSAEEKQRKNKDDSESSRL